MESNSDKDQKEIEFMITNKIYPENCRTGLSRLPENSIHCCVTSPPYFGLRDYGTAQWEGGDTECDHTIPQGEHDPKRRGSDAGTSHTERLNRAKCYRCGAVRIDDQIGIEETPEQYIANLIDVFREVKRVLRPDGTLWVNIGDSYNGYKGNAVNTHNGSDYAGHRAQPVRRSGFGLECKDVKPKDLIGIPWMLAFALRADGWYLRQDIIWHKPNPMPESVKDRCTKSHEYIFLLSKRKKYYFDAQVIAEPATYDGRKDTLMKGSNKYAEHVTGLRQQSFAAREHERWRKNESGEYIRNKRSVWSINTVPYRGAHFATFPEKLIVDCIRAGCPEGGIVLDPFMGSGTTACVAQKYNRDYIGYELNPEYVKIAENRLINK